MLILDLGDDTESLNGESWDFPSRLLPRGKRAAGDHGLVYDMVGRGLYNPDTSHFIARYAAKENSAIFTYDGMRNNGHSVREKKATLESHLCGSSIEVPKGFRTHVAVYHLRGGLKAQEFFRREQIEAAHRLHHLAFSGVKLDVKPSVVYDGKDMTHLADEDRYWMSNPYSDKTAEYVTYMPGQDGGDEGPTTSESSLDMGDQPQVAKKSMRRIIIETSDVDLSDDGNPVMEPSRCPSSPLARSPAPPAPSSVPSQAESLFPFNCRCGASGDGNTMTHDNGPAIQCTICDNWSHIACQRDGRASQIGKQESFTCDFCGLTHIKMGQSRQRASTRMRVQHSELKELIN